MPDTLTTVEARPQFRLMLLGARRICEQVLRLIYSPDFVRYFDLRVIVSDEHLRQLQIELSGNPARYISNERRKTEEIVKAISEENIDLLISIQHNWILDRSILDAVRGRAFNLHNARLPDYKGFNAITHAILNEDRMYASTLHWMVQEVDVGDIAFVVETPIADDDTAKSLYEKTVPAALEACRSLLVHLSNGLEIPRIRIAGDTGKFNDRGSVKRLANVTKVGDDQLRARIARATYFPPHNAAYFEDRGKRYYIIPEVGLPATIESFGD